MRRAALALVLLAAACSSANDFTLAKLAGPTNMAAVDAAAACQNQNALALTRSEMSAPEPSRRLMANFTQAAILTDLGRDAEANSLLATAAANPELNPNGQSVQEFAAPSAALLQAIRERRTELTGSATC